jgi:hypothetical protein
LVARGGQHLPLAGVAVAYHQPAALPVTLAGVGGQVGVDLGLRAAASIRRAPSRTSWSRSVHSASCPARPGACAGGPGCGVADRAAGWAELVAHVRQALGADRFDQVFAAGIRVNQRQAVAATHGSAWRLIGRDEAIASGLRCMAWFPARTLDEPSPSSVSAPRRACGWVGLRGPTSIAASG